MPCTESSTDKNELNHHRWTKTANFVMIKQQCKKHYQNGVHGKKKWFFPFPNSVLGNEEKRFSKAACAQTHIDALSTLSNTSFVSFRIVPGKYGTAQATTSKTGPVHVLDATYLQTITSCRSQHNLWRFSCPRHTAAVKAKAEVRKYSLRCDMISWEP